MVSRQFNYLDSIPIRDDLISPNLELEDSLDYKRQFNLALVLNNSDYMFNQHIVKSYNLMLSKTTTTFKELNLLLETYLITLLNTSTISNLDSSQLSNFFIKRKSLIQDYYNSPESSYLELLLYGGNKVWGGRYGSLLFSNFLRESLEHYSHPSSLADSSIRYFINSSGISSDKANTFFNKLSNYLLDDPDATDVLIYNSSYEIFSAIDIYSSMKLIEDIRTYLPNIIRYYLANNDLDYSSSVVLSNIRDLSLIALRLGIDNNTITSELTPYKFIHQSIPMTYVNLTEEIISYRKGITYSIRDLDDVGIEADLKNLFTSISLNIPSSLIRDKSYFLIDKLFPPGGFNTYLVLLATALINRAYIITHPSNNSFNNLSISPVRDFISPFIDFIGRVNRLVFMAGYCLKKTDLDHLNIIGSNLIVLSQLDQIDSGFITNILE